MSTYTPHGVWYRAFFSYILYLSHSNCMIHTYIPVGFGRQWQRWKPFQGRWTFWRCCRTPEIFCPSAVRSRRPSFDCTASPGEREAGICASNSIWSARVHNNSRALHKRRSWEIAIAVRCRAILAQTDIKAISSRRKTVLDELVKISFKNKSWQTVKVTATLMTTRLMTELHTQHPCICTLQSNT